MALRRRLRGGIDIKKLVGLEPTLWGGELPANGWIPSGIRIGSGSRIRSGPNKLRPLGPRLLHGPIIFALKEQARSGQIAPAIYALRSPALPNCVILGFVSETTLTRVSGGSKGNV